MRLRVQELLDQRFPLTVLAAPPGYGKTVSLVQWLLTTQAMEDDFVVWVDVRSGAMANDVWLHILLQLEGPGRSAKGNPTPAHVAVDALLGDSSDPVTVVIDSCHHLHDSSILDHLARLVQRYSHLRVIIATRSLWAPAADISHVVDSVVITDRHLGLTAEECLDLFRAHGVTGGFDHYRDLNDAVGGWPTLIHRAALSAVHDTDRAHDTTPLIAELMSTVPKQIDQALANARAYVSTTLLPEFLDDEQLTLVQLCSLVTLLDRTNMHLLDPEMNNVSQRLTGLTQSGVLHVRHEIDNATYTMWPLVRDALNRDAEKTLPAALVDSLRRRFLQHYIDVEYWPEALTTALEIDDPVLISDVVARSFIQLALTHDALLKRAFARIPPNVLECNPVTQAAKRALMEPQPLGESRDELPDGTDDLHSLAGTEGVADLLLKQLVLMLGARMTGNLEIAGPWSHKLTIIVEEAARLRPDALGSFVPGFNTQTAVTLQVMGELRESSGFFRRALETGEDDPTGLAVPNAHGALGLHAAIAGDMPTAADWIRKARRDPPYPGWMGRRLITSRRCAEAWLAMEDLDLERAEKSIGELLGQIDDDELWGYIAHVHSLHAFLRGDSWIALDTLARLHRRWAAQAPSGSYADLALLFATFDHELALGHGTRAENVLRKAPRDHTGSAIRRARLALLSGDLESVLVETFDRGSLTVRERIEISLLRACAKLDRNEVELASRSAESAVRSCRAHGLRTPLATVPTTRLLQILPLMGDESRAFCQEVVDSSLSPLPSHVEILRLTDREIIVLRASADGLSPHLIAHKEFVSINTVKSQLRSLYRKLEASNLQEALLRARRLGLIPDLSTSEHSRPTEPRAVVGFDLYGSNTPSQQR